MNWPESLWRIVLALVSVTVFVRLMRLFDRHSNADSAADGRNEAKSYEIHRHAAEWDVAEDNDGFCATGPWRATPEEAADDIPSDATDEHEPEDRT